MEKIKELLESIGASKELADALCEHLERYSNDLKEKYSRDLHEKVEKAKQICVEEVAREKVNLARKVEIFLESKAKTIEQAMSRQRVAEETEATAKLKRAKALLEDIDIEGGATSRELRALEKKADRLQQLVTTLREEKNRAVSSANRANAVAVKSLRRAQLMEATLKGAGAPKGNVCSECGGPVAEGTETCEKCSKAVEGKEKVAKEGKEKGKALSESKKRKLAARLDGARRKSAKPVSTRRTLVESEIPANGTRLPEDGSVDITKIANDMSD